MAMHVRTCCMQGHILCMHMYTCTSSSCREDVIRAEGGGAGRRADIVHAVARRRTGLTARASAGIFCVAMRDGDGRLHTYLVPYRVRGTAVRFFHGEAKY